MSQIQSRRSQTFSLWKFVVRLQNPFMTWLLQSPFHGVVSKRYMLITFTGRKSGKQYTTPVQYKQIDDKIIFVTSRHYVWWKNLHGGAKVQLLVQGKGITGKAETTANPADVRHAVTLLYPSLNREQVEQLTDKGILITIHRSWA